MQNPHARRPRHAHASLTLGLVLAGERVIMASGRREAVAEGELFCLPPGQAHACEDNSCPLAYLVLSVPQTLLPEGFPKAFPLRLQDPDLAQALLRLAEAAKGPPDPLEAQCLLADILERLAAHGSWGCERTEGDAALGRAAQALRQGLENHPEEPADLALLAEKHGVGTFALHRAFARLAGLPPQLYRTHLRLARAKELLRAGATPIEAALEAGFCDQSHLNRHFARLVGLTPAQYARAYAKPGKRP